MIRSCSRSFQRNGFVDVGCIGGGGGGRKVEVGREAGKLFGARREALSSF